MEAADVFTTLPIELKPDPARTVIRPFGFGYPAAFAEGRPTRAQEVAGRLMALEPAMRERMLCLLHKAMRERHRNVDHVFLRRFEEVKGDLGVEVTAECDRLLIGAYFSQEYAFESAALFNPSIVSVPDQDPNDDSIRFILSLRGVGEGHISSVTFRSGTWDGGRGLHIDPPSSQGVPPRIEQDDDAGWVRLRSDDSEDISETVIFPILPSQRSGVEDLRLTHFTDHDGVESVIGTYTAFDGKDARQEMLRGIDVRTYEMRALTGAMTGYKGMALFPRRINGQFVMLGRQDSENIWLLRSDDLHCWETGEIIMRPRYPWEFVQLGNCGSPIEIDEGWLVITHGVGSVRNYCLGASLLDKEYPSKLLGRMELPLVHPSPKERDGYVPNVVYSCGALVHDRTLLLPYGVADSFTTFATVEIDRVLQAMV